MLSIDIYIYISSAEPTYIHMIPGAEALGKNAECQETLDKIVIAVNDCKEVVVGEHRLKGEASNLPPPPKQGQSGKVTSCLMEREKSQGPLAICPRKRKGRDVP